MRSKLRIRELKTRKSQSQNLDSHVREEKRKEENTVVRGKGWGGGCVCLFFIFILRESKRKFFTSLQGCTLGVDVRQVETVMTPTGDPGRTLTYLSPGKRQDPSYGSVDPPPPDPVRKSG